MKTRCFICVAILLFMLKSQAQTVDLKGFKFGDNWLESMNSVRKNYSHSFSINPDSYIISFGEGIISPLKRTIIYFQDSKLYKIRSYYSLNINRQKLASDFSFEFVDKSANELHQEYETNTILSKQKFIECYSYLESKYGEPIKITEAAEAIWNIDNTIIRLYAITEGLSWTIQVDYEAGYIKTQNTTHINSYLASGSGIILTTNGIIVTNYHVIKGASMIEIQLTRKGYTKTYKAKVLINDKHNDLALLKIEDSSFPNYCTIPYALKASSICDVGTKVFAMGYPMSNHLGEEVKITDGLISSKTGYQGDIVTYQISAPIQPGSSGGPLFDNLGNLIGITNSGIPEANNVGYAIKASYLKNLIDVSPINICVPTNNIISNLPFTEKIKILSQYVVFIKIK